MIELPEPDRQRIEQVLRDRETRSARVAVADDLETVTQALRDDVIDGSDYQVASLLVCAVAGALWRYGPMDSYAIADRHGISAVLVERALAALMSNNEARFDKEQNGWVMTYPVTESAGRSTGKDR